MTYLARPRLYFYGKALVNPPTANNAIADWNGVPYYNPAQVELDLRGNSPEQFREWLHLLNYEGYVNALWNYYGDNGIRFEDATITSVEYLEGDAIKSPQEDSCIGSSVSLQGSPYQGGRSPAVLVDLDPTDGFTTQLFAQSFRLHQGSRILLEANTTTKAHSRWINFWRNLEVGGDRGSSAMWQLAFPGEALTFPGEDGSPALTALHQGVEQGQGIVIRLCFYLFYHRPYREIAQAYQANQRGPMPGRLVVAGSIGVWHHQEPATLPAARILMPELAHPLDVPDNINSQRQHPQFYLGVALAETDTERKVITLDLINTFPEAAAFDTLAENIEHVPEKINLGDVSLHVLDPGSRDAQCIGVIPFDGEGTGLAGYNKAGSLLTGGIIEMPYAPEMEEQILNGDLVLLHGTEAASPMLMRENPYHVLVDQRSLYLELEDKAAVEVPFRVLKYGQPLSEPLTLRLEQTLNQSSRTSEQSHAALLKPSAEEGNSPPEHTHSRPQMVIQEGGVVEIPSEVTTDAEGYGTLSITPLRAGMCKVWLYTPEDPDLNLVSLNSIRYFLKNALHYFLNVRVLPDDSHYDQVPDEALTWEFMVEHFFRYYSLLYPIMNSYINFDDPIQTQAKAALIRAYVSEGWLDSTLYMPITREMSAGKRRLVQRWASLQSR